MDALQILRVLDAPQLGLLAPELMAYRDRVAEIGKRVRDPECTSCARNDAITKLAVIAAEMHALVNQMPALAEVIPVLMQASQQATRPALQPA